MSRALSHPSLVPVVKDAKAASSGEGVDEPPVGHTDHGAYIKPRFTKAAICRSMYSLVGVCKVTVWPRKGKIPLGVRYSHVNSVLVEESPTG